MIPTLGEMYMRVFKNPCDDSFAYKLVNNHPYCYLLHMHIK